jgi:hypothetical protein
MLCPCQLGTFGYDVNLATYIWETNRTMAPAQYPAGGTGLSKDLDKVIVDLRDQLLVPRKAITSGNADLFPLELFHQSRERAVFPYQTGVPPTTIQL